ncbi:ESX secretion-associated protein EspG [Nocardia stercoris]|uniref:ESX secretion-associated protein EspG n=1 Tax=Nocardia stercoris TaxID=2483361 RepID=A0A3M2KV52_9NOCA|nr:ESX secretion-associated protein EspG [Nocardia stercoris]RMI29512.1 ESX secretion-associated protein EspG [Nocardia stercoris]
MAEIGGLAATDPAYGAAGSGQPVAIDLSVDGARLLRRLTGIESYPAILEIYPDVYSDADQEWVDEILTENLTEAGILVDGQVEPVVAQWLSVLDRPDVELAAVIWDPAAEYEVAATLRLSLVRADELHVLAVRFGDELVIQQVFAEDNQLQTVGAALLAALGPCPPLHFDAMRATRTALLELPVDDPDEKRRALLELGAAPRTAGVLSRVGSDVVRRAEAVVTRHEDGVVAQPDLELAGDPPPALQVLDTPEGRIVVYPHVAADSEVWVTYVPGDDAAVHAGIRALAGLIPGGWFGTRRV